MVNSTDLKIALNNILDLVSSATTTSDGKSVRWGFDTEMDAEPILSEAIKFIQPILEQEYENGYDAGYDDRDSETIFDDMDDLD